MSAQPRRPAPAPARLCRSGRTPSPHSSLRPAKSFGAASPRSPGDPSRTRELRRSWGILSISLAALLLALSAPPPAAAAHYSPGEKVQFTGIASDSQGQPLANVRVVLEVSRSYFSLRDLRRAEKDSRRVAAATNGKGEYALEWPWDGYFNHFELLVGVPVRKGKGKEEELKVLEQTDVSDRVLAGSPVVSALMVKNRQFVDKLREFVASVRSGDERKTYEEMGTPDEVKRVNYPTSQEASWWYFEAGLVYRFRDGRLEQVTHFDPVSRP